MTKLAISFDIGGTKTRVALVDKNYRFLYREEASTPMSKTGLFAKLSELLQSALAAGQVAERDLAGIGISFAGGVNSAGRFVLSPNTPFKNMTIAEFKKVSSRPIKVMNDMQCAALAELHLGAGRQHKNFLAITISTGVGAGLVINGQLYRGANNLAGEIGKMIIAASLEEQERANKEGNFEYFASGNGLWRLYQLSTGKKLTPREIQDRAEAGETRALQAFQENGVVIGLGLASLSNALNPDLIIASGSHWLRAWKLLDPHIKQALKHSAYSVPKIIRTPLRGHAPLLGAAILVFQGEK